MKIIESKKIKGVYCCVHGCSNDPIYRKGGMCHKHYARKIREKDPVQSRYNQMRSKAKSRGLRIMFTLEEFRLWCVRNRYIVVKGNRGMRCTIDRRCNAQDYYLWNMQILTLRANSSKSNRFKGNNFEAPF